MVEISMPDIVGKLIETVAGLQGIRASPTAVLCRDDLMFGIESRESRVNEVNGVLKEFVSPDQGGVLSFDRRGKNLLQRTWEYSRTRDTWN